MIEIRGLKLPILRCILSLFLILMFCSGCTPQSSSDITLKLSTWGSAQEITVLKGLLRQFEKQHPHVHVRVLHIPENYYQKLHLLIAGDMAPDVMLTNSVSFPIYASQGVFLDLKPYFNTQPFYPAAIKAFTWQKGKGHEILGALPRDISDLVIFYNKDLMTKVGISFPKPSWTWTDFLNMARHLTLSPGEDGIPRQFGFSFYATPPLFWLPFVWSAGGNMLSNDLQHVKLNEYHATEGLKFYADLRNRWHVAPTKLETGGANMTQLFLQQKLAMMLSGRWIVPVLREQAKFNWDVVPFPIGPSGQSRVGIDASGYAVSATTPHRNESLELLHFLLSRQAIETVASSGLIVPARPDVANSSVFLSKTLRPEHPEVFLNAIDSGVPTQTPPRWNEFSEVLNLALEPVWDGQQSPSTAIKIVQPQLNALLMTPKS